MVVAGAISWVRLAVAVVPEDQVVLEAEVLEVEVPLDLEKAALDQKVLEVLVVLERVLVIRTVVLNQKVDLEVQVVPEVFERNLDGNRSSKDYRKYYHMDSLQVAAVPAACLVVLNLWAKTAVELASTNLLRRNS